MEFVIYALDKPGDGQPRQQVRAAHLRVAMAHAEHFIFAGPLLGEDGHPRGSLYVLRFEDRAALDAYMAQDPYFSAGVYESVTVWPSRQVVPEALPGALQAELERQLAADADRAQATAPSR
ncbi:hypothetical protein IS481_00545 [Caldimonas thermodepolymerans]|jgi:uncharacterized protein YciI|uniref:YCII-related domain-containing protein n=1 Tax=Caldimonas thermodepolymerans TaxID=215580 RepID=A0A2S5T4Q4_9BURK|nr:YciI family protein [Caldimonas thermodepolymerans]PPE69974.1 hypothetical protein C1702_08920 [Caldimonas thermodepolymerans]QPC31710.1 hypothetical protein IS481_00545 [Caldimonas thermodepolymerans]RDI01788.1 hypothetical protein DES46_103351 [Caldimonas thermodepolymerans]TCP05925.1 hypothetical protein EV676_108158 [Caldimonas thermodepolymerans]UZG44495.1 YciI family protein [Caldimonas thermodepolymerans]